MQVEFESRMFPNRAISGRPAFSSALHCVVMCVGRYHNRASSVHFAEDCFDVLVAFNADIEKVRYVPLEVGVGIFSAFIAQPSARMWELPLPCGTPSNGARGRPVALKATYYENEEDTFFDQLATSLRLPPLFLPPERSPAMTPV